MPFSYIEEIKRAISASERELSTTSLIISLTSFCERISPFIFFFIKTILFGAGEMSTSTFCPFFNDSLSLSSEEITISFFLTRVFAISTIVESPAGFLDRVLIKILPFVFTPIKFAVSSFSIATGIPADHFKSFTFNSIFLSTSLVYHRHYFREVVRLLHPTYKKRKIVFYIYS